MTNDADKALSADTQEKIVSRLRLAPLTDWKISADAMKLHDAAADLIEALEEEIARLKSASPANDLVMREAIATAQLVEAQDRAAKAEADEREACAAICDAAYPPRGEVTDENAWIDGTAHCARAIRQRGQCGQPKL